MFPSTCGVKAEDALCPYCLIWVKALTVSDLTIASILYADDIIVLSYSEENQQKI